MRSTPVNNTNITLTGSLSPSSIVVNNSAVDYSISGPGKSTGATSLTKSGTNTLTINNANGYTGGTTISGGTISLNNSTANVSGLGSGPVTLDNGVHLFSDPTSTVENGAVPYNFVVNTTGTIFMTQRGTLTGSLTGNGQLNLVENYIRGGLNGDWSGFHGTINVTSGGLVQSTADFRVSNNLGYANAKIHLGDLVNANSSISGNIVVVGELTGTNQSTINGSTWKVGTLNTDAQFDGSITSGSSIDKIGTGKWTLTGQNNYTGTTTVESGTLAMVGGGGRGARRIERPRPADRYRRPHRVRLQQQRRRKSGQHYQRNSQHRLHQ